MFSKIQIITFAKALGDRITDDEIKSFCDALPPKLRERMRKQLNTIDAEVVQKGK